MLALKLVWFWPTGFEPHPPQVLESSFGFLTTHPSARLLWGLIFAYLFFFKGKPSKKGAVGSAIHLVWLVWATLLAVGLALGCGLFESYYFLLLTSYFLLLTSYFLLLTSYFLLLTSDF